MEDLSFEKTCKPNTSFQSEFFSPNNILLQPLYLSLYTMNYLQVMLYQQEQQRQLLAIRNNEIAQINELQQQAHLNQPPQQVFISPEHLQQQQQQGFLNSPAIIQPLPDPLQQLQQHLNRENQRIREEQARRQINESAGCQSGKNNDGVAILNSLPPHPASNVRKRKGKNSTGIENVIAGETSGRGRGVQTTNRIPRATRGRARETSGRGRSVPTTNLEPCATRGRVYHIQTANLIAGETSGRGHGVPITNLIPSETSGRGHGFLITGETSGRGRGVTTTNLEPRAGKTSITSMENNACKTSVNHFQTANLIASKTSVTSMENNAAIEVKTYPVTKRKEDDMKEMIFAINAITDTLKQAIDFQNVFYSMCLKELEKMNGENEILERKWRCKEVVRNRKEDSLRAQIDDIIIKHLEKLTTEAGKVPSSETMSSSSIRLKVTTCEPNHEAVGVLQNSPSSNDTDTIEIATWVEDMLRFDDFVPSEAVCEESISKGFQRNAQNCRDGSEWESSSRCSANSKTDFQPDQQSSTAPVSRPDGPEVDSQGNRK